MIAYDQDSLLREVRFQEKRAKNAEAKASRLLMTVFLLAMTLAAVVLAWAIKPNGTWELDTKSPRPEATFYYQFWWKNQETHYIWATNSSGNTGWLPLDGSEINKDATPLGTGSDF